MTNTNTLSGYWFFTTHGIGPGMMPKRCNLLEVREGKNENGTNGDFILLDDFLTTEELKEYDLRELSPEVVKEHIENRKEVKEMKKVYELTTEEFKTAIEKSGMSDELFNDALDMAYWRVDEITDYFYHNRHYTIDFSIGYCNHNYLKKDHYGHNTPEFLSDCLDLHAAFCIFSDELYKKLVRMEERAQVFDGVVNGYDEGLNDKNEDRLIAWMEEGIDALCKEILDYCVSEYDYHVDNMFEIALELDLYSDYFVDSDGKLYKKTAPVYMCNGKTFDTYAEMAAEYNRTHEDKIALF